MTGVDGAGSVQAAERVEITDVVTRDGFQDEAVPISTEDKVRVLEGLMDAGLRSLEVTSFVHPRLVPQMADAEAVMQALPRRPGVRLSVLVPNLKGAERALACRPDEIRLVVSASESHNRANLNRSVDETLAELAAVTAFIRSHDPGLPVAAAIATTFGCPFEGKVPLGQVVRIIDTFTQMGVHRIGLADTTGMANPAQVAATVAALRRRFPEVHFWLHLHNTRGLGLANAYAGYQAGIRSFDTSLGGIGGCPFAPGATGNVSTEDMVHMFHEMGVETGIDLDRLLAEGRRLRQIVGHELESAVQRAGKASDLHPLEGARKADSRA
ncbi:MAG TPA: hydroxymethylglutaryl-CoA lyase [Thermaerobacter sp.]